MTLSQPPFDNAPPELTLKQLHLMFQKIDYPFLIASFASLLVSVGLWFLVDRESGAYVGLWVPSILTLWVGVRVALLTRATANLNRKN